jgi:hypothetical protein
VDTPAVALAAVADCNNHTVVDYSSLTSFFYIQIPF